MYSVRIAILLAILVTLQPSHAATDAPMKFSTFWPCAGNASFCGTRILAQGAIQRDSGRLLAQFLSNPKGHAFQLPPRPTVVFDSPGGNVAGAIELGRVIRKNRMDTEIGTTYSRVRSGNTFDEETLVESPVCASACTLAFSGGLTRSVQAGARLGIHQFAAASGAIGDSATQVTVVVLASYFEEMGVQRSLLDRASLVPPSSMLWLSNSDAGIYRLDNTGPEYAPWRVTATPQGDAILEVLQPVSQGRDVHIKLAAVQGRIVLSATTILAKSAYRADRIAQFPAGEPAQISICGGKSCFQPRSIRPWVRSDTESHVRFQAIATLTPSELQVLATSTALSINDDFGTATSDVSLTTNLSMSGFSSGANLLLRLRN